MANFNKHITYNPYLLIPRKICQTHERRKQDIVAMKTDLKLLQENQKAKYWNHIADLKYSEDVELDNEEAIKILKEHIKKSQFVVNITDEAILFAVSDIEVEEIRIKAKKVLSDYLSERTEVPFLLLDYPEVLSRRDFDRRKRNILKYILRKLELMPYVYQPRSGKKDWTWLK